MKCFTAFPYVRRCSLCASTFSCCRCFKFQGDIKFATVLIDKKPGMFGRFFCTTITIHYMESLMWDKLCLQGWTIINKWGVNCEILWELFVLQHINWGLVGLIIVVLSTIGKLFLCLIKLRKLFLFNLLINKLIFFFLVIEHNYRKIYKLIFYDHPCVIKCSYIVLIFSWAFAQCPLPPKRVNDWSLPCTKCTYKFFAI